MRATVSAPLGPNAVTSSVTTPTAATTVEPRKAAEPMRGAALGTTRTPRAPGSLGRHRADANGRFSWLQGSRHGGTL